MDGIQDRFFPYIAQAALDEEDRHKKNRQTRHIKQDLHQNQQFRLIVKICLQSRQCQDNNRIRLGYGVV